MSVIALLTDFGLQDVYVGVMKGTIASIDPSLQIIDLTHLVPPQNILAARFCLMDAYPYCPSGTIYVAVVDPGVGSQRRGVAIQTPEGYLIGPDNGLFSGVLELSGAIAAVHLTNSVYWRTPNPSPTFHGRDIFAPVAAHLASGVPLQDLGGAIDPDSLVRPSLPPPVENRTTLTGYIQYIDRFGNLITNIPATAIAKDNWRLSLKGVEIPQGVTYSDVPPKEALYLIGSHGWLEIAVHAGNAQAQLQLDWGDSIQLLC